MIAAGSPRSSRPPAVTGRPPLPPMRYGSFFCQAILLVVPLIAVKVPLIAEPIGAAWVPPL